MYQLANFSNYACDLALFKNFTQIKCFLQSHHLDGFEAMYCNSKDQPFLPNGLVKGVHLRFLPAWIDFWRGNEKKLLRQFGSKTQIEQYYGGLQRDVLVRTYQENLRQAVDAGAEYVVFHVSHACPQEIFTWKFSVSDREVVEATIEMVNLLVKQVPPHMAILFENLWWPGLTLINPELVAILLENIHHSNIGIMLDTGHLMNMNQDLRTEAEGVAYILKILHNLGEYRNCIRGVHLHRSLSGEYIKESKRYAVKENNTKEVMDHILKIDEHLPFATPKVQQIIDYLQPEYLVHEFMYSSLAEWSRKIVLQQSVLQGRGNIE